VRQSDGILTRIWGQVSTFDKTNFFDMFLEELISKEEAMGRPL
jgi:hypothetical protein